MTTSETWTEITDLEALRELVGEPAPAARDKDRTALVDVDVQWLQASPFCVIATAGVDGQL